MSRLRMNRCWSGRFTCTLVYTPDSAQVYVADAPAWPGHQPFRGAATRPLDYLAHFGPLGSWAELRAAAAAAPSCAAVGREDGVGYHHAVLDSDGGLEASWSNPDDDWSACRRQSDLASAYRCLVDSVGMRLAEGTRGGRPGTRVRVRVGVFAGATGRVERLDREADRVRVVTVMGGRDVTLDLGVAEIEGVGEPSAGPHDAAVAGH